MSVFRLNLVPPAVWQHKPHEKCSLVQMHNPKMLTYKVFTDKPTVYIFTECELHSLPPQFHCFEFVGINILWQKCTFSPNIFANGCLSLLPERLAHFRRARFAWTFNIPPQNKWTKMWHNAKHSSLSHLRNGHLNKWISYQNVHVSTLSIYMIHEASMSGWE